MQRKIDETKIRAIRIHNSKQRNEDKYLEDLQRKQDKDNLLQNLKQENRAKKELQKRKKLGMSEAIRVYKSE